MPEFVKIGAAFTIGLGAGILASKRFFQLRYEKIAEEEIESVKAAMAYRSGHIIEKNSVDNPDDFVEKVETEMNKPGGPEFYSSLGSLYSDPVEESRATREEIEQTIAEREHPEEDDAEEMYMISEEQYSETKIHYDKKCLHYYMDDGMLVDAIDGDLVPGEVLLPQVCRDVVLMSDEPVLYFRDDTYGADYEVLRMKGCYYQDVK